MIEHTCEVLCEDIKEDCGEPARFRIRIADDPDAVVWWCCTDHFNELLDDPHKWDPHVWEEV